MNIVTMEPLGIPAAKITELAQTLELAGHKFTYYDTKELEQSKLLERCKTADILILANQPLSRNIIEHCPNLKMISVAFTGVDHIDLAACKERKITVCNAAGYSTNAVAELVFGLAISLCRNIVPCDQQCRTEGTKENLIGCELFGKKFGIIGTGAIGSRVAEIARVFGCEVYAYSRTKKPALIEQGIQYVELTTLLATCDFISLHVPLNNSTNHLIDDQALHTMKPTAVLINTARGNVVDNTALAAALNSGEIAGAGIDVFEIEPPIPADHALITAKNTILTPHIAFASNEALLARAVIVFENIHQYLNKTPQNLV